MSSVCIQAKWPIRPEFIHFFSMKPPGIFLLRPEWDASPSQGYSASIKFAGTAICTPPGWREDLAHEYNTISLAMA